MCLLVTYLSALEYTLSVTAPVFLVVFLGLVLKARHHISEDFISTASWLVFNVCLPLLIFISMIENAFSWSLQWKIICFSVTSAVVLFVVFWLASRYWVPHEDRGVVVQGAFRSNLGIIGLALCAKAFGGEGLAVGALLLAVVTPVFNVLSVFALNRSLNGVGPMPIAKTLGDTLRNPLIIAIILGLVVNQLDLMMPKVLYDAGNYLAQMTLPLALIAIGGSLSLRELKTSSGLSVQVVFAKLLIVPVLVLISAYSIGFKGVELGCLMLMFASPTATASFIMVKAMGGNYALASNIIAISTLFSGVSISLLLYLSVMLGWLN